MKILKFLSFGIIGLLVIVLVAATIVEHVHDTRTARELFYASPAVLVLWGVATAAALTLVLRRHGLRQRAVTGLHVSFAVILCGAAVTHFTGEQGTLELVTDSRPVNGFLLENGRVSHLPFSISLKECETLYYPGTRAGADYVSHVILKDDKGRETERTVSMNRILHHQGYRFYQTGMGEGRSVLTVTHDPWGIGITYAGYVLLAVSMVAFALRRDSRFRRLWRRTSARQTALTLALAGCFATGLAAEAPPQTLQRGLARDFGRLYVYHNERICPLQTLARDFCTKLCGSASYKGLTAEQVLTGWLFHYEEWKHEPMIRIKDKATQKLLGITGSHARLTDFYDNDGYKLEAAGRDLTDRAVQEADEKCRLIAAVCTGAVLKIYPCRTDNGDGNLVWLSWVDDLPLEMPVEDKKFVTGSMEYVARQIGHGRNIEADGALLKIRDFQRRQTGTEQRPTDSRFEAELIYNRLAHTRPVALVCLVTGLLAYALFARRMAAGRRAGRKTRTGLSVLLGGILCYLTSVIALRGYVAGYLPLSNGFETMQFMAWCSAATALMLRRRFSPALPFGLLLCGLSLMVSVMGESNPSVTPLLPVLASPLLSLHVVVIMISYTLLAVITLNSLTALVLRREDISVQLAGLNRLLLTPALLLLTAGIFVGAVWANQSWGCYWSWDPKETWALITLLVYCFPVHEGSLTAFRRPLFLHIYLALAFATVLMTYFGVNFLLGGMHSYA